jgi:transcriptional regulator with XRE-family HTH domain
MTLGNELFALAVEWLYDHNKVADQKELAQVTGITETTISRILNNKVKKPSDATVRKLLNAFSGLFNPNYFRGKSLYMLMSDVIEERIDAEEKKQNALDMDELLKKIKELEERIKEKEEILEYIRKENADLKAQIANSSYTYPFPHGVAEDKKSKRTRK